MATITSLPLELLVMVSSQLNTQDLGALRRTCKSIEKALFDFFAKEFFSKRQFMLTQPSLQALVDISKHPGLSAHLKHVIVGLEVYRNSGQFFSDRDNCDRYSQGDADQFLLLSSGLARDMLEEAFQNLTSLETIGIRDTNIRNRGREKDKRWTSYGVRTIEKDTGVRIGSNQVAPFGTAHHDGRAYVDQVFQMVLLALGRAGSRPSQVEILLFGANLGLHDLAFNVTDFSLPVVGLVLGSVKSLLLAVNLAERANYNYVGQTPDDHISGYHLRSFLGHTAGLTHLRLNFLQHQDTDNEKFLQWFADTGTTLGTAPPQQPSYTAVVTPPPVVLRNLQRLDLGMLSVRPDVLINVFVKFAPTLKAISLRRIVLFPDAHNTISEPYTRSKNLWEHVFRALGQIPALDLNYLSVSMLQLRVIDSVHVDIDFYDTPHDQDADFALSRAEKKREKRYELLPKRPTKARGEAKFVGGNIKTYLRDLVDRLYVAWPYQYSDSEDEDDEDDEDVSMAEDDEGEDSEDDSE